MTWDPFQEPTGGQGPYTEYGAYRPATGPQMPPPLYGAQGAWAGAQPGSATPLTLWEAIKQLPKQYWRVLTKPGAATFEAEMGSARWDIIWVQVLILALVSTLLVSLLWLFEATLFTSIQRAAPTSPGVPSPNIFPNLFLVPIPLVGAIAFLTSVGGFFLGQGIAYLLAKAFGGQGSFMVQAYTTLLYQVPITIVGIIPFVGAAAGIYGYVLEAFQLMAVHRLSTGKAITVVVIPIAVGFLLGFVFVALFFVYIFNTITPQPVSP